jgi:hypothetical protein
MGGGEYLELSSNNDKVIEEASAFDVGGTGVGDVKVMY